MSSSSQGLEEEEEDAPPQSLMPVEPTTSSTDENNETTTGTDHQTFITCMVGATVPTGFEHTAAEEVQEKIGAEARISKDRGRIYFQITTDKLFQVHLLKSVDNLFVVVEEYDSYQFKDSKEEALKDLMQLVSDLPWTNALDVWKLNNALKKKKGQRRRGEKGKRVRATNGEAATTATTTDLNPNGEAATTTTTTDLNPNGEAATTATTTDLTPNGEAATTATTTDLNPNGEAATTTTTTATDLNPNGEAATTTTATDLNPNGEAATTTTATDLNPNGEAATTTTATDLNPNSEVATTTTTTATDLSEALQQQLVLEEETTAEDQAGGVEETPDIDNSSNSQDSEDTPTETKLIKFRVTCNRSGDKHSFSSNEAARDFGGAVQDFFQWKADMTKFDIEVLLNISGQEVVIGIALTEESLHRRNITHFGPTTLRSTLCYGMLRLCKPQPSDIIIDPMCGTGAIPLEGAIEFQNAFYMAGDNNAMAINRTVHNICHVQKRRHEKGSAPGLPIDTLQWDLCHLPIRTSSVDIIITDMPFGKRMGSRKKNWDLYPSCLREMARVVRPGSGTAALLTQDKKCFQKAISRMGGLWKRSHTVWINVGGLHAGVFLLKRTAATFGQTPEDVYEPPGNANAVGEEKNDK